MDLIAKERIRTFVGELNRGRGTTVILTTHDLDDLERLCSRLVLIDHGVVLYDGGLAALKSAYAPHREVVVQPTGPATAGSVTAPGATVSKIEQGRVWLRFDPKRVQVGAVLAQYEVSDLSIVEPDLEGFIRRIYSDLPSGQRPPPPGIDA